MYINFDLYIFDWNGIRDYQVWARFPRFRVLLCELSKDCQKGNKNLFLARDKTLFSKATGIMIPSFEKLMMFSVTERFLLRVWKNHVFINSV